MRVEYYNNVLCVEAGWLIEAGIVSESNYKLLCHRGGLIVVRRACRNHPALIAYESMPTRFKDKMSEHGNIYDFVKVNAVEKYIQPDAAASKFFSEFLKPDGKRLTPERQREYYANAVVLNALRDVMNSTRAKQRALGGRVNVWGKLTEAVAMLDREKYPHTLPENEKRLKDKLNDYLQNSYQSIVHKGLGNKTAARVDDDIKASVMLEFIADPRNLDNVQIRNLYNMMAERLDWKKISAATVGVWRNKYELESTPGNRGLSTLRNTKAMQVKRKKPTYPLYYWTTDGWDAELLYQKTGLDSKGNSVTTYHNRPTLVVVLDPCVNYPVGFAIGTHETPELITEALRDAVNHTAELFGQRYKTHQLQSDHYSIKTMSPVYESIAEAFTPAAVKNAKAKVVEPYFKYLQKNYCQFMPNWSGFGVTARKENQPNADYLNKYRHSFPDEAGCRAQLEQIMAMERTQKQARFLELFNKMPQEDKIALPVEDYLYYFGASTQKNRIEAQGLTPTILGEEHFYDCFDLEFRKHSEIRWTVKYDPDDLTQVLAINDDGTLRFMLQDKYIQPMALKDRAAGDAEKLQGVRNFNKGLEEHITQVRADSSTRVQELFAANPRLNDTLAKLVLVDSHGQHKNQRNAQRALQTAEKISKKQTLAELKESEDMHRQRRREYVRGKVDIAQYIKVEEHE